jgi:hypothetical protein
LKFIQRNIEFHHFDNEFPAAPFHVFLEIVCQGCNQNACPERSRGVFVCLFNTAAPLDSCPLDIDTTLAIFSSDLQT